MLDVLAARFSVHFHTHITQKSKHLRQLRIFNRFEITSMRLIAESPHASYLPLEPMVINIDADLRDLEVYEVFVDPYTRYMVCIHVMPDNLRRLRLSGKCGFPFSQLLRRPARNLRHVVLHAVDCTEFDQIPLGDIFMDAPLESFAFSMAGRVDGPLSGQHLLSLVNGPGRNLRKLVLLGANVATPALSECLDMLSSSLEYLALAIIVTDDAPRINLMRHLPSQLMTLKIQVRHVEGRPSDIGLETDRQWCHALERYLRDRNSPMQVVHAFFGPQLAVEDGLLERWKTLAEEKRFRLDWGLWDRAEAL
ncbi:hypothetical protein PUNSTDRAFT_144416 [Punctularia strigosozonata HHB-11173 SS5]|uniref:uncharacterized protein n=1 Tax=Punctularia strigosozonata (strain HHB-11173) TaxID=741275 RepID=UPI0004416A6E|nr:uncharacterized protein PUNSTDRAFT_144416 [Punctularia strigosozonata HHB-11173 SS5]EIN07934.1 hypothetical protein PUNSTDRAFT_144416 [Punctularia strigosozonata HHB-11173 SS5]